MSRRAPLEREPDASQPGEVVAAVALNALWVAGGAAVLVDGPLTAIGSGAVAAVAAAGLVFAGLEIVGLRHPGVTRADYVRIPLQ